MMAMMTARADEGAKRVDRGDEDDEYYGKGGDDYTKNEYDY